MCKKIDFGKTPLTDLYKIFKFTNPSDLENKRARLLPNGNAHNEITTTSIFLASLRAVKEYREELFSEIGIKKLNGRNAKLHVYTELENSKTGDRPDGLMVITSGKHNPIIEWACFVEAKVADNVIDEAQIEKYVEFAREVGINDTITISNQLVSSPKESPVSTRKRSFNLYHWSWTYLKVTGSRLIANQQIEDEDHVYVLEELRRYFDSHKNLKNFVNMGKNWKDSVNTLHSYSVDQKINSELLDNVVQALVQEEKDVSLQLTDKTGAHVELPLTAKSDRIHEIAHMLQTTKVATLQYMLDKDKKRTFSIDIDFTRQKVTCSTCVNIDQGKAQSQTTTLIKKLEDIAATDHVMVNAYYLRRKSLRSNTTVAQLIEERKAGDAYSILDKSMGDTVKSFEIKTKTCWVVIFKVLKTSSSVLRTPLIAS